MLKTINFSFAIDYTKYFRYGFVVAVIGLLISGFYAQVQMDQLQTARARSFAARNVILEMYKLSLYLEQAETGQRGFLLTGSADFLRPYENADTRLDQQVHMLEEMVKNNPHQLARLKELHAVVESRVESLQKALVLKGEGKDLAARSFILNNQGRIQMEKARSLIAKILVEQNREAELYIHESSGIMARSKIIIFSTSVAAVILLLISLVVNHLHQREQTVAEEAIRFTNAELAAQKALLARVIETQQEISLAGFDQQKVLSLLVKHAQNLTGARGAVIELLDKDDLVYNFASGPAEQYLGARIPLKGSFSGTSVKYRMALKCDDTETDERVNRDACRKMGIRSMIVTPLEHNSNVLGALKCYSAKADHFSLEDLATLQLVAGFLSSAFARAAEFTEKNEVVRKLENTREQLIVARDQAEAATRYKTQFLANISHEVRTPLHGILGLSNFLLETKLDTEQRDHVTHLRAAGEGLLKIVNDILDLTKIEAGKLQMEELDFDLKSTMQDLHKTFALTSKQKNLEFHTELDPQIPAYVKGDPGRLRQVLVNLVGNAIKFTDTGFIDVNVRLQSDEANLKDGELKLYFEVKDSGEGISEQTMPLLFKEFMQADVSTTRKHGGTGLGLSICKRMIEQMNGEIGVKSELGKGTTFWFTVTMRQGYKEELPIGEAQNYDFAGLGRSWHLLVVDDNILNQKIAVKTLEKLGITCEVATNGAQAIETLRTKSFDLVLMDCQMPEMDGYQATAIIRQGSLAVPANIPIIAMTASAMKNESQRCLDAGMDDYVSKPFSFQQIAATLDKWFVRQRDQHSA